MQRREGFSLIELVISVAIIGLLASVAIPSFVRFQLRSNSTEAVVNLASIAKAQTTYYSEYGQYVSVGTPVPAAAPGSVRMPWPATSDFDLLGWRPEGSVMFQYLSSTTLSPPRYTAEAMSDLDNNSDRSFYAYIKPAPDGTALAGAFTGTTCVDSGVYNPSTGGTDLLETAGPCDGASGRSAF